MRRWVAHSAGAALWVAAACVLAAWVTWLALPPATVEHFMGETGPVERVTAATYALCAIAIWRLHLPGDDRRSVLAASVVMLAFCARELDWHKTLTGSSVLRLSWYAGPASPGAKALAAGVVLVVVAALAWLVLRHAGDVVSGLRRRRPTAVTILVFIVMLVAAKTLDRSASILIEDIGVDVSLKWKALRTALEEWFELGLSMLLGLWLLQHRADAGDA
jgi:hypothetical protein